MTEAGLPSGVAFSISGTADKLTETWQAMVWNLLLAVAIGAFVWAVRKGQFDDLDTPPLDMLRDDDRPMPPRPDERD